MMKRAIGFNRYQEESGIDSGNYKGWYRVFCGPNLFIGKVESRTRDLTYLLPHVTREPFFRGEPTDNYRLDNGRPVELPSSGIVLEPISDEFVNGLLQVNKYQEFENGAGI
jgi:hypothetical protein